MAAPLKITVAIPSIPSRANYLNRAVRSVTEQTHPTSALSIALDLDGKGAAVTRQRALDAVRTEWTAFLDDDDWFYPNHLETLAMAAEEQEADYVFSYYMVHNQLGMPRPDVDPLGHFGKVFDPDKPHQTTITMLVRTELAKSIGFRKPPEGALINGERYGEDFQFTVECAKAGAKIVHTAVRTWSWVHHSNNTSGLAERVIV
jgi:glycosyltransferase involved in cell wall biosynthesis